MSILFEVVCEIADWLRTLSSFEARFERFNLFLLEFPNSFLQLGWFLDCCECFLKRCVVIERFSANELFDLIDCWFRFYE